MTRSNDRPTVLTRRRPDDAGVRPRWPGADDGGGGPGVATLGVATLEQLIEASPVATLVVDEDLRVVAHNQAAARTLSTHSADLASSRFAHPVDAGHYELMLVDDQGVRRIHHVTSEPFAGLGRAAWLVTMRAGAVRAEAHDHRPRAETHDRLTGLANRELLLNRLADAVRRDRSEPSEQHAVVAIDLDRFDRINERHGTATGDRVLRAVANRLTAAVRPGDYVGRTGGDEFAVLLGPRRTAEHLDAADRLAAILSQPVEIDGVELLSSPVIGIAEPVAGDDERSWLAAAEDAASAAVGATPRLARRRSDTLDARRTMISRLPTAAAEGQLFLQYQPIFTLADRALVGLEALVRWEHPDDGLIAPDEFIQVADESGAIVPLGEWVVAEVCEQLAEWRSTAAAYVVPPISINVTSRQLVDPDFRDHVRYQVTRNDVAASSIRFEVTERALADHDPHTREVIQLLVEDGFAIDLDEFGSGVSSLTGLLENPISALKVPRSVVARLMDDAAAAKLVLAAIEIGRSLELPVTAIGVENRDQCAVLERWGCERAQGFLLARPLNPIEAVRFFARDPASLPPREGRAILRSGLASSPAGDDRFDRDDRDDRGAVVPFEEHRRASEGPWWGTC